MGLFSEIDEEICDKRVAKVREELREELKAAYENLTATQVRCNELLAEVRAQKLAANLLCRHGYITADHWVGAMEEAERRLGSK